jgi:hypothetical protein
MKFLRGTVDRRGGRFAPRTELAFDVREAFASPAPCEQVKAPSGGLPSPVPSSSPS